MTQISDNFVRANGALGGSWAAVVPNNAESGPDTFAGGILINNNGYGPITAFGGDCAALWNGGQSFGNDQQAQATIKTVAGYTAVLSITAAVQIGGNTTYTYTVTSGDAATPISGGALYVVITGMADAGNNGTFTATTFGVGTFTVANASGVTRSGQTGVGSCPSDTGVGVMVRGSGTSAATLNGYFFAVGTNSFGGGGRIAQYELWKIVNGVGTILGGANDTAQSKILPVPGDVIKLVAVGTCITALYNGVPMYQVIDSSVTSGVPGLSSWSISGAHEYIWTGGSGWTNQPTAPGNNGTTANAFSASDIIAADSQLASDTLLEGVVSTQLLSDSFVYANGDLHTRNANWVYGVGTFQVSSNKVFSSAAGIDSAYRSDQVWPNDQYSEVTAVITGNSATQNGGPAVRVAAGATTFYGIQYANNAFNILKEVAGTLTVLASHGSGLAVTGDLVRLQVVGNCLTAFINGVAVAGLTNITDNSIASGNAGIWAAGNATINGYSSWAGGKVLGLPSQFTTQSGAFFSDTTAGAYPVGFDANGDASVYQNTVTWPNDQYSEVKMSGTSISGAQQIGPAVRMSTSADTWYQFYPLTGSLARIVKIVAGTATILRSVSYTFVQGDVFRLEVQGNLLVGRVNGTVIATAFDSSIASGKAGFIGENTVGNPATPTGTFKNFAGGGIAFGISGNAGVAGATVSWTGASSGSVTADGSGNYNTGEVLLDGNYTITPSLATYTFSPVNSAQTIAGADISGVNFVATQLVVATPTFSPVAGSYTGTQSVTISSTDSGLSGFAIYYTTDGSTPTTGSTLYTGPVSVSTSLTLKAIAVATGYANSAVGSAAYTISASVYSVPDCRVAPFGPNASRTIQGTKIYDVQTTSNIGGVPVDSRAAGAPVDSRVSAPQNSRAPGTFGPGE